MSAADGAGGAGPPPLPRPSQAARRPRLAATMAVLLCAVSCGPGFVFQGLLRSGHASFEETASQFPEIGEVEAVFDRLADPAPGAAERRRQLDLFAEVFTVVLDEYVEPLSAQSVVLLTLEGFELARGEAGLLAVAEGDAAQGASAAAAPAPDAAQAAAEAARAPPEAGGAPANPLAAGNLMRVGLEAMLAGLDPHTDYLAPDVYREMQLRSRGEFGGIGIEVTMEEGLVKVIAPLEGTPGARAGLESGDFITHVDGAAVLGLTLAEAVKLMRGPSGSEVRLDIRRDSEDRRFSVTIERATVRVRPVQARAEGRVGVVRVANFNERAEEGVRNAVRDLGRDIADGRGYILDLRNNPGGLLDQAIGVADAFLAGGEIVSTRGRGSPRRFPAGPRDHSGGAPVIVLIDGGSASASEIVAGALQDRGRALVLGERSFGKGSVQTIVPLGGGGAARLTTALYFTPSGRSIQSRGIRPDVIVADELAADEDEDMRDLDEGPPPRRLDDLCPGEAAAEDPALACALRLLEGREVLAGRLR